jgi:transcription elongation GreA/GreB family factor
MLLHGDLVRAAADAGAKGTEAVIRQTGEGWLRHPDVKDVLAAVSRKDVLIEAAKGAAVKELEHELDSREGRMRFLKRVIDGTATTTKIAFGEEITCEPEMKDRLNAFKMLAHMHGDFERKEISVSNTARVIAVVYDNGGGPLPYGAEVVAELPADLDSE